MIQDCEISITKGQITKFDASHTSTNKYSTYKVRLGFVHEYELIKAIEKAIEKRS